LGRGNKIAAPRKGHREVMRALGIITKNQEFASNKTVADRFLPSKTPPINIGRKHRRAKRGKEEGPGVSGLRLGKVAKPKDANIADFSFIGGGHRIKERRNRPDHEPPPNPFLFARNI